MTTVPSHIVYEQILRTASTARVDFDVAVINQQALDFAATYTYNLVSGITDTTRKMLQQVISTFVSTPGMTEKELEALIEPAFGPVRAKMIAVTETTRAYSAAVNRYRQMLEELGLKMTRYWHTRSDEEHVCDICRPLNNKPEQEWAAMFPEGPPAHINCRCGLTLRLARRGA